MFLFLLMNYIFDICNYSQIFSLLSKRLELQNTNRLRGLPLNLCFCLVWNKDSLVCLPSHQFLYIGASSFMILHRTLSQMERRYRLSVSTEQIQLRIISKQYFCGIRSTLPTSAKYVLKAGYICHFAPSILYTIFKNLWSSL